MNLINKYIMKDFNRLKNTLELAKQNLEREHVKGYTKNALNELNRAIFLVNRLSFCDTNKDILLSFLEWKYEECELDWNTSNETMVDTFLKIKKEANAK